MGKSNESKISHMIGWFLRTGKNNKLQISWYITSHTFISTKEQNIYTFLYIDFIIQGHLRRELLFLKNHS